MRNSKTLAKLRDDETVKICNLGHFIPAYVRHAAHFGFDCIWLDLEHRTFTDREVQALLALCHQFDIDCMVRAPTLEKTRLYRYLEDGAAGLMIPHVSTAEKAQMLVDAVKFPPIGDRGIDGAGLDSDFHLQGGGDYTDAANRETFLVVQIETPEAVENADAIAAIEGVDGLFVGPGDLGLRIAKNETDLTLDAAFETVASVCEKHKKSWGTPCATVEVMQRMHDLGGRLIAHGGEFGAIMDMLKNCSSDFDAMTK